MLTNRMPRYEPLSTEALELIHSGWERLGREVGVQFDNPEALRLFAEAGQTVDGETVFHVFLAQRGIQIGVDSRDNGRG